ncbi:MAG: alginate lyase family protein [Candidatus Latescibacterota bacterium]|nr:alginate lyase family protein [Candidatus Latescibacterota bacterium]
MTMPRIISDRDLLEALDCAHPGLESVGEALADNNIDSAKDRLIEYCRRREAGDSDRSWGADHREVTSERGESLCNRLANRDWLAVAHPEDVPERLYSTQVMTQNDHHEFVELAQEYIETGNDRYAQDCVVRMLDWLDATGPLPTEPPVGPTGAMWRTIHYTSPRAANWTRCLWLLSPCPAVTVNQSITILKVILHHLRYAAENRVPGMPNMVAHHYEHLINQGRQWPEFSDSDRWIEIGVDGLAGLLDDYFYPDGAYIELCYFAHESFVRTLQMADRGEIQLPPDFRQKVESIFDFPAYMVKPNGSYPSVNDNYSAQDADDLPKQRGGLIRLGVEITGRDDLRYIETFGAEGEAPALTSCAFPYAGFYVMRSDWSAEARYLVFDGGMSAGGHNHVDKLSFELYAYGNTLVTDCGCAGPWASEWRSDYFVGPAGHNTIMIDGRGQVAGVPLFEIPSLRGRTPWHEIAPEPLPNTWVSGKHFDYVHSRYQNGYATYGSEQSRLRGFYYERSRTDSLDRMQPWTQRQAGGQQVAPHERLFVDHERRVFFAKPDYWILSDRLLGNDRHQVESLFHFQASAEVRVEPADNSVRTVNGRAGLTILPAPGSDLGVRVVSGQQEPLQGWVPAGWGEHRPAPTIIYSVDEELPLAFDMVLYPYPKDEAPSLALEQLNVLENDRSIPRWQASGLCVHIGERHDYYLVSHERRALRSAGPLLTDADLVFVRCDADGRPEQLTVINGSYVELAGRRILAAQESLRSLEVAWISDRLCVHAGQQIGLQLWTGGASLLVLDDAEPVDIEAIGDQLAVFENWLH